MTVLQLGPYPPPWGGVQANLVSIREYLRSQGHDAPVINITRHRQTQADGVYYPGSAVALVALLLRLRYDVLHLHLGGGLTLRLLALYLVCNAIPGRKTVLTFHSGGYPSSPAGRSARSATLRGFVFRRFDALIAVNEELVALFGRFGVSKDRIHLIQPHALSASDPGAVYPSLISAFIRAHKPLVITVGLLEPEYDLPLQIKAIGRVRQAFPDAGLLMVGSGSLEAALRGEIDAAPWHDHVLLAGDVPHDVTLRAIAESDLMLRTTLYDGDAVSVREALHLGTPVIATDNGMRPPGVRLIPTQDAEALDTAIQEALNHRRSAIPQATDENLRAVLELYKELL